MNLLGTAVMGERCFAEPVLRAVIQNERTDPLAAVRQALCAPDHELDYLCAKLAFDRLIEPDLNIDMMIDRVGRLTDQARDLAGPDAPEAVRLGAVRKLLFDAGPWNGHRPIEYDHEDCFGRSRPNKLLRYVLEHRLGQCVSMPILFLIIADRLGLNVGLCSVPEHLFVRYTAPDGRVLNIETTSGGHPARDSFIREHFPMTDRSIETGLYMRTYGKRESIAAMASTILEHWAKLGRHEERIRLAELILQVDPRQANALIHLASAYGYLARDLVDKFGGSPFLIPTLLQPKHIMLAHRNEVIFRRVEALGWREPNSQQI